MARPREVRDRIMATLAILCALAIPSMGSAQSSFGSAGAVFPEDFGTIQAVRELSDGRVLVADPLGRVLYAVDMDTGSRTVIGSEGRGPQQYLQPDAVWPLPGDSTLLVDLGNGRLVVVDPDFSFVRTMPIATGELRPGGDLVLAIPQGVDEAGGVYSRAVGGLGGALPDSAAILRIDRGSGTVDRVATFKLEDRRQTASGGAGAETVQIEAIPLSSQDAWGVAPDGTVVIARSGDYSLEWVLPDGRTTRGSRTPFEAVGIGVDEKEEWVTEQGRSGGGIGISVSMTGGGMQLSFSRGGLGGTRGIDQYDWPDTKPPFYSDRIVIDNEGRAWVRRHVQAGGPSTYDVFDRSGTRVDTFTLETGKRLIGFGAESAYVVAFDELDRNYLERYAAP